MRIRRIMTLGAVLALTGAVTATSAQIVDGQGAPYDQSRFVPLNPDRPNGIAIITLKGDPATGPSDMLMRFGPAPAVMHSHTADYRLVVISGEMKHWVQGQAEADVGTLGPGAYWYQPGGQPHVDICLTDSCVMFLSWLGARDVQVTP